jgi:hypothetical protein
MYAEHPVTAIHDRTDVARAELVDLDQVDDRVGQRLLVVGESIR